jgi:hypothetical protein
MLAATLLAVAAALPLGVWPTETGPAATTVHDVQFYLVDPEDDYSVIAVQALAVPLRKAQPEELDRLAAVAERLGADGVLLLGELPETSIPEDPDAPLPTTGRYSVAVFVSFSQGEEEESKPAVPSARHPMRAHHRGARAAVRASFESVPSPQRSSASRPCRAAAP